MGNLQSNPSSSTQTFEKNYEVFLNFRGVDSRDDFTNYLYEALLRKSIETFPKEDQTWPTLLKAIRESKISVVIFSKEYASSKWCLRELVEIMECGEKYGQTVIPVFYNVTAHDVYYQEGSFKDGFDQLEKEFEENLEQKQVDSADVERRKQEFYEEMQKWRQALKAACDLRGWLVEGLEKEFEENWEKERVYSVDVGKRKQESYGAAQIWRQVFEDASRVGRHVEGPESKVIDEIVKYISEKLMRAYKLSPCDFKGLFGIEERLKEVESLLCLDKTDIRIIGIWGMGGLGKTTIADAIYHQISKDEYGKCFVGNIRQRLEQCGGLVSVLQQEVLSKVLNDQDIKLDAVSLPQRIKEKLCQKKVFIVLDDVDDFLKLQELAAGLDQLAPGSRIIITTRSRDILHNCGVNEDYIYQVKGLSYLEARQLFCKHAFRQSCPPTEDLMALSHEILRAIDGNPLGLKVAGSSLLRLNKLEWRNALSRLKKSSTILKVLQISYNGLEEEIKHTFLDIACFFVGEHEDYVAGLLGDCSYSLKVLSDSSFITVSNDKIIQMHDLLQEMGREIVCKESLNNPSNRSRLWTQENVLDALKNGDVTNATSGIFLNMSKMNEEHLSSQAFEKMKNLRFLKFYDSTISEYWYYTTFKRSELYSSKLCFSSDISYLSNKLRSLNWLGYPLKALPSNFIPEDLVELNLRHSNIEKLWEYNMSAPKLKWIILKVCPYLIKVSDLVEVPLLEKIDIELCDSLLDIELCQSLPGNPSCNNFPALTYLRLSCCGKLTKISDLLHAPFLEKVNIDNCRNLHGFPSPAHHFNNLRELNLRNCENLQSFPECPFPSLLCLDLSKCINLASISDCLDAPLLETINLEYCKSLQDFPPSAHHFNNLRELNMRNCHNLLSFPNCHFPSLVSLDLFGCINLACISDCLNAPLLETINLEYCKSLQDFPPPACHFNNLHELNLKSCYNLQSFPNCCFPSLVSLDLSGCINFASISDYLDAPLLETINLEYCQSLRDLPVPAHHFNNLRKLTLSNCDNLQSFPNNITFPSLVYLDLSWCINLASISDQLDAPLLETINVESCNSLQGFPPPAYHFSHLRELSLSNCKMLWSFPNNIPFPSLISLDLSGCINLARISDVLDAPLLEKIDLYNCKSLLDFPRPAQHFNNLCNLNLQNCKSLSSFPSDNIHCPSLKHLDFRRCINLTKFPLISGNIKKLYMTKTAIHQVPSTIENLPELVELVLAECPGLNHISSSIGKLEALRKLDLSNCPTLEYFPKILDTMESLEVLDLSGTAIKVPPHSIQNFSGLQMLYLRECKSLHEVPSSIENLTELVKLNLAGCTSLKHILFNICKLKALRELNLSSCSALECFPEISNTMGSLKMLDLGGTAIKALHHSIEYLSGLEVLRLRECKNLKMLPISIYNLTCLNILDLSYCSKLENLHGNSVTDLSNCGESTTEPPICRLSKCELCFTNCLNLNKMAVINIMELQINQHRDMTTKGCGTQAVDLQFFYPGSEVPGWFKRQTGSSINIQMSGHDGVNGHLIGLAACAVIEFYDDGHDDEGDDDEGYDDKGLITLSCSCRCYCKDYSRYWINSIFSTVIPYEDVNLEHVALWYSNKALVLEPCGKCTNYLFEFYLGKESPNCGVKYCGVCPIYEKHNITLPSIANEICGAADKDFGETLVKGRGKIRKFSDEAETSGRSNEDVIEIRTTFPENLQPTPYKQVADLLLHTLTSVVCSCSWSCLE